MPGKSPQSDDRPVRRLDSVRRLSNVRRLGNVLEEDAHAAEFLVALLQQGGSIQGGQFAQHLDQVDLEARGHLMRVAMGAAERFLEHGVDDAELEQVLGGETQRSGCARRIFMSSSTEFLHSLRG